MRDCFANWARIHSGANHRQAKMLKNAQETAESTHSGIAGAVAGFCWRLATHSWEL
jgi:hypothetical protein